MSLEISVILNKLCRVLVSFIETTRISIIKFLITSP